MIAETVVEHRLTFDRVSLPVLGARVMLSSLFLVILLSLTTASPVVANQFDELLPGNPALIVQQRQHYLSARDALRRGHMVNFRKYRKIWDFPTLPHPKIKTSQFRAPLSIFAAHEHFDELQ